MMKKALRAGHLHAQASAFEATEAAASDSSFFDLPILPDFRVESPSFRGRHRAMPTFTAISGTRMVQCSVNIDS
ncbi:hypothetical protein [Janthinobacterium sp. UMAB-56]|uniref:hypothetical protein n=1 Tax=Janthinobacterium sp. UMAB-56 TaxID=1365361 RepID=UPI001C56E4D8|nr:hypothetical protein [Janthinobacterium sp. UMAB-56]